MMQKHISDTNVLRQRGERDRYETFECLAMRGRHSKVDPNDSSMMPLFFLLLIIKFIHKNT